MESVPILRRKRDKSPKGAYNNSIITKRSVEKVYFPNEPAFCRPFVLKFRRKSPAVNRLFLLRTLAIERTIKQFLDRQTDKSKVVVHLGCGYDPLPFRIMWKYSEQCRNVDFVDVDSAGLMQKKIDILTRESIFKDYLSGSSEDASRPPPVLLNFGRYFAIGCSISSCTELRQLFLDEVDLEEKAVLFIYEVPIGHVSIHDATALLNMCSTFLDAQFCLLDDHTLIGNENSHLSTSVGSRSKLGPSVGLSITPSMCSICESFRQSGWAQVYSVDLWSLWHDQSFMSDVERKQPNSIETCDDKETLSNGLPPHFTLLATSSGASFFIPFWNQDSHRDVFGFGRALEATTDLGDQRSVSGNTGNPSPAAMTLNHESANSAIDLSGTCIATEQIYRVNRSNELSERLYREAKTSTVAEALDIGPCTSLWTPEYLKNQVGQERLTSIHSASQSQMSFREKNFAYETVPFGSFIDHAVNGSHVYMRALSSSNPSKLPANLERDYPNLAPDFRIPKELAFIEALQHSSVLRITGNITMWLHYDVMANILCQIKGSKRVILFPPSGISRLDFPAGETTSGLNVLTASRERLDGCRPLETILREGEILFIPACWPHTTAPAGEDLSVAVNVFFRSFEDSVYAAGRDVYGNRDLEMYQNGRKHIGKMVHLLGALQKSGIITQAVLLAAEIRAGKRVSDIVVGGKEANRIVGSGKGVPEDIRKFYLARLSDELLDLVSKR